jgi:uncharacterized protein (TIGR03435 family)
MATILQSARNLVLGFVPLILLGQPSFEFASVKALVGPTGGIKHDVQPTMLTMRGVTLGYCVRWAYGLEPRHAFRTVGPSWIDPPTDSWYEIVARSGAPTAPDVMRSMLRALLEERFKLVLHRDTKEVSVYQLIRDGDRTKLQRSGTAGDPLIKPEGSAMKLKCERVSMARLAEMLGPPWTGRPIVDATGLEGIFDFVLDLESQRRNDGSGTPTLDGSGKVDMELVVIRALPQLGLKLRSAKVPVDVLVVDHAEKTPVQN